MQKNKTIFNLLLIGIVQKMGTANAESHSYINQNRQTGTTYVMVQQSLEGENGQYYKGTENTSMGGNAGTTNRWTGYNLGTGIGLEAMRFFQLSLVHHFINLHDRDDSNEKLTGSRVNLGLKVIFQSPFVNLELGNGLVASRMDYQKLTATGTYLGSGSFYSLGLNYFTSSKISLHLESKWSREHANKDRGSSPVNTIDSESKLMGIGARIWI